MTEKTENPRVTPPFSAPLIHPERYGKKQRSSDILFHL